MFKMLSKLIKEPQEIVNVLSALTAPEAVTLSEIKGKLVSLSKKIDSSKASTCFADVEASVAHLENYAEKNDPDDFKDFYNMSKPRLDDFKNYVKECDPDPYLLNLLCSLTMYLESLFVSIKYDDDIKNYYHKIGDSIESSKKVIAEKFEEVLKMMEDQCTLDIGSSLVDDRYNDITVARWDGPGISARKYYDEIHKPKYMLVHCEMTHNYLKLNGLA